MLSAKRLANPLQECIPGKLTIAVLVNPDTPFSALARAAGAQGSRADAKKRGCGVAVLRSEGSRPSSSCHRGR